MIIPVKTSVGEYNIVLERGALAKAKEYLNLNRRVFIVTDNGVPEIYAKTLYSQCENAVIATIEQGEASKSAETFLSLLQKMVEFGLTRTDCVVAVGGGVVGDLAGFCAACYMRGIEFYNIPTTVLSQVDSSIGGKTAVDFLGYKNIIGAFHQPKAVIIDADTLKTLPKRQISNGLAEAVKMSLTSDAELFRLFEREDYLENLEAIIEKSLYIKRFVVEQDEKESGLRKILNFGHTLAHAVESINNMQNLYHGECVALGMLPMCSNNVKERLVKVLKRLNLPTEFDFNANGILDAVCHDKKMSGDKLTVIFVGEIGKYEMREITVSQLEQSLRKAE